MSLFDRLAPAIGRTITLATTVLRPLSLGVRVVALLPDDRVVLVRHGYLPGWYLPGGGVDPGETMRAAARRELAEETGYVAGAPTLFGVYHNARVSRRNHIGLYVDRAAMAPAAARRPDWEIVEIGAFPLAALPEGTTEATRRRLAEVVAGVPASETW
jgi:ADP-ribose pyrophosphatase YjhB (NUDIX family)